jgi:phage terminase large subunit
MIDWRNPDYTPVWQERIDRLTRLREKPEMIPGVKEFYKDNPVQFITDWGVTFDPRLAEIGLETTVPFLLFPKQAEFVDWIVDRWRSREDGLAEKSRDMGVSWLCVAIASWMWLFHPGVVIGFGSRKEEYVDKLGDPKSLFWKIRQFIDLLPPEFKPEGYVEKKHAPYMNIKNPENGSVIVGEAGDNIGRGARTSIYFKDESAFYERPETIDAALSQTSNCKIDVSTPNGNGNPFYRKRHGGKIPVFTFHWRDDPRKDDEWRKKQESTLDPVVVAQEIDIDYNASVTDAWLDGAMIEEAQNRGPADVIVNGPWIIGIDAAHQGDDESVITARRGLLTLPQITVRKADGPELAGRVIDECRRLEAAGGEIGAIVIELDGPGVSCYDVLKRSKYADVVYGIHTGARLQDDRNYNLKASIWRLAQDYLKAGGNSMPRDPELKSQLSAYKYGYKDGLLLMEPKKDYKKRLGKSPDRADSWVLTFAGEPKKKKPKSPIMSPFRPSVPGLGY